MLFQYSLTASPLQQQYFLKSCHYRSLLKCDLINFVQLIFKTNSVNRSSKKTYCFASLDFMFNTKVEASSHEEKILPFNSEKFQEEEEEEEWLHAIYISFSRHLELSLQCDVSI